MKIAIGCVYPREDEAFMDVKGRCLLTGLPKTITVSSAEMMEAFEEPTERILESIHAVLERTPPELVADVSTNGRSLDMITDMQEGTINLSRRRQVN